MDFDDLSDAERTALAHCRQAVLGIDRPLRLDCGIDLGPYRVAYQTYGRLNAAKSNAILICHALTGDQFVAETHPVTGKAGWWETLVGPGKVLDRLKEIPSPFKEFNTSWGSTTSLAAQA